MIMKKVISYQIRVQIESKGIAKKNILIFFAQ